MIEWLLLALAVLLVAACGVFVAAEFAFVTVDRATLDRAVAAEEPGAAGLEKALQTLSTQLSGAQLGITVTNLAIGFLAEPALGALLQTPLTAIGLPSAAVPGISLTLAFVLANLFTMVIGELVPKNLAIAAPMRVSIATQGLMRGFSFVFRGPIRVFNGAANRLLGLIGIEPQEELRSARNPDELASLVRRSAAEGTLDDSTADLIERSLIFGTRSADDVMTPRVQMETVDAADPVSQILVLARSGGHSRFPVVESDADQIVGVVHIKHALTVPAESRDSVLISSVMAPASLAPTTLELDPLLTLLREDGLQLALVIDEYGGTAGVVTLEDVVEEIVGEIADEHDRLAAKGRRLRTGDWSLSGLLRPDEVTELTGYRFPPGLHSDTIAGLTLEQLGRLAEVGDEVEIVLESDFSGEPDRPGRLRLVVERLEGRRIDRVRLHADHTLAETELPPRGQTR